MSQTYLIVGLLLCSLRAVKVMDRLSRLSGQRALVGGVYFSIDCRVSLRFKCGSTKLPDGETRSKKQESWTCEPVVLTKMESGIRLRFCYRVVLFLISLDSADLSCCFITSRGKGVSQPRPEAFCVFLTSLKSFSRALFLILTIVDDLFCWVEEFRYCRRC